MKSRKIYLVGDLAEKFGASFSFYGNTLRDALRCIDANRPGFRDYVVDCMKNDIAFCFETEDSKQTAKTADDLVLPIQEGDFTISTLPAGSKSGLGKILASIVLFTIVGPYLSGLANANTVAGSVHGLGGAVQAGKFMGMTAAQITSTVNTMALNLAITGIQQVMAPDPEVDGDSPTNYLFTGDSRNLTEGDPVPVLYGELKVPGLPIAMNVQSGVTVSSYKLDIDGNNNITPRFEKK